MTETISEITSYVSANDGTKLFYRQYPVENERGGILIVHGVGEHSGRYQRLTRDLTAKGMAIFSYDQRGHGQSSGKRGHVVNFEQYINDLEMMIETSRQTLSSQTPFFLLGHSMGGLIVLNYAQQNGSKIDGLIVSCPGLEPAVHPPKAKIAAAKVMSVLMPSFSFDNELNVQFLSHDQAVVDAYVSDPFVHRRITARWGIEFMNTADKTLKAAHKLKTPVLMQVAGDDKLVNPDAAKEFYKNISASDKTLQYYDAMYHEIYNETEDFRRLVLNDLETWINDHA